MNKQIFIAANASFDCLKKKKEINAVVLSPPPLAYRLSFCSVHCLRKKVPYPIMVRDLEFHMPLHPDILMNDCTVQVRDKQTARSHL